MTVDAVLDIDSSLTDFQQQNFSTTDHLYSYLECSNYYLLTGCEGRTSKYKPEVFHRARACEGCMKSKGLVLTIHKQGYSVRTRKYEARSFLSFRGLCIKVTDRITRLVNRLLDGIIIFQTKVTFLKDLHIAWYVILIFENRLSCIKVSENKTG